MKRLALLALGLFAVLSQFVFSQTLGLTDGERSVMQIVVQKPDATFVPFGTAFFVREDGLIATALHVSNQATLAVAENRGGAIFVQRGTRSSGKIVRAPVELVKADAAHDIALMRLMSKDDELWNIVGGKRPIVAISAATVQPDSEVRAVGYVGQDLYPVTLNGHLAGAANFTITKGNEVEEFLISAIALPGESGSPVLLNDGNLLGVLISIIPQNVPFSNQPIHSGLARVAKVEHLKTLITSVPILSLDGR